MALVVSPTSVAFAGTAHGTNSAATTFTLTPDVTSDSIFGVKVTPTNATTVAGEFTVTETFDATVGAYSYTGGTVVTAPVTFTAVASPITAGSKAANIEVHYNGSGGAATLLIPVTQTAT